MYNEINNKIDEIIDCFNNSYVIKDMIKVKKELKNDKKIKDLLDEYVKLLDNPYDSRCISIKKELLSDSRFSNYKKNEDELFLLVLMMNEKLKIFKEKRCVSENN